MTFEFILNEESFNALDEVHQAFYTKQDDGNYQLAVNGLPDTKGLKAKHDELLGETKAEREKRRELEAKLAELEAQKEKEAEEIAKKAGDIATLEKSYQDKMAKSESDWQAKYDAAQKQIYDLTVGAKANELANELAIKGSADVLLPHIQNRLTLETDGDSQKLRVLDKQGNISALTIDDLKQEFRANDAFKPIISGGFASGSGAVGGGTAKNGVPVKYSDCKTDDEKLAWLKANN
ncbi:hypothetical protein B0181_11630 [Moraxella caviae]|uniref:Phage minor structural protein GP20 n=1 Tax=Moraxella caviae TaxID=34060 RepID=A0A1S9ZT27_9GAMM|nr:OmpH family outer membrane protein [Moraxella caviae]OOR86642.1 hypothetical protein B0181_11630 [Moraxella caviae]STZ14511.1 Uncharacterised protein [Moraxella caviae]VEW11309.1 Uncharacterised protein [Moraxella caviae]